MAAVDLIEGNKEASYSSLQSGHKVRDFGYKLLDVFSLYVSVWACHRLTKLITELLMNQPFKSHF